MADPVMRVSDGDVAAWGHLALMGLVVDRMVALGGDPAPTAPLAADDAAYPWELASSWAQSYLRAAGDHLATWADLVTPAQTFPGQVMVSRPRPWFTLARGAMESASQAWWMLAPVQSEDRVRRHLDLMAHDLTESEKALRLQGDADGAKAVVERRATMLSRADHTPTAVPSYFDLVSAAAPAADITGPAAGYYWRLSSAAAHGRNWFVGETHTFDVGEEYKPGQFHTRAIPDAAEATAVFSVAVGITMAATTRFLLGLGANPDTVSAEAATQLAAARTTKVPPATGDAPAGP